jgi:ElaB/YqjD/DUF883 family membrane-anchored ribosome-binding protein
MELPMTTRDKEDPIPQKVKDQMESESRELSQQVENLRNDLAELGKTVRSLAKEGTSTAQRGVRDTADRLTRRGHELAEDAKTAGQQAVDYGSEVFRDKYSEFETTVRRHPTTAVAVALGLGYLAGLISRNRS